MISDSNVENTDIVSLSDLKGCGWELVLSTAPCAATYGRMRNLLSTAATEADRTERPKGEKALRLLANICSMMLTPSDRDQPFRPFWILEGEHSKLPEDFADDIPLLEQFLPHIDEPKLKARVADVLWLVKPKRDYRHALVAVEAYKSIPLTAETWVHDALDCWSRAIGLSLGLGSAAHDHLSELKQGLLDRLDSATTQDLFYGLKISGVLVTHKLGSQDADAIARKLEGLAEEFEASGDYDAAEHYFAGATPWYREADNEEASIETTVARAEVYVSQADAALISSNPSHLVAAHYYEDAIQTYRSVPRTQRGQHRVEERMGEIRERMEASVRRIPDEMVMEEGAPVDLGEAVESAQELVKGKAPNDALWAFLHLDRVQEHELRETAADTLRNAPFVALASSTYLSEDRRVVGRDVDPVDAQMMNLYRTRQALVVSGLILPALDVLTAEHRFVQGDFIQWARVSPAVPPNRERTVGRALYLGYVRDFATAIHLLPPQVEHMVRFHLQSREFTTTILDDNGIQSEKSLGALMGVPEVTDIFGEDMAFEIRASFCHPLGGNLRNDVGHGLLDDRQFETPEPIYAWWLVLRLVLGTGLTYKVWSSRRSEGSSG